MKSTRAIVLAGAISSTCGGGFLLDGTGSGWFGNAAPLMAPNLGLAFVLAGVGVMLLARPAPSAQRLARGIALALVLGVAARIAMNFPGWSPRVRALFVVPSAGADERALVYFASAGAVCFLLTGAALGVLSWRDRIRAGEVLAASLAVAVGVAGMSFPARFMVGAQADQASLPVALVKSALFAVLGAGLFCAAVSGKTTASDPLPAGKKLSVALGTTLGMLIVVDLLSCTLFNRFIEDGRRASETRQLSIALGKLQSMLEIAEVGARGFVATGAAAHLQSYRHSLEALDPLLREVIRLADDPADLVPLAGIKAEIAQLQTAVDLRPVDRTGDVGRSFATLATAQLFRKIARDSAALEATLHEDNEARNMRREASRVRTQAAIVGAVFAIGVLLLGVHLVFERDLAARRRSDAALRRHNETLRSFAHSVAHDLRAPLRGIAGYARELEQPAASLDERSRFCIHQIAAAAQNLEQLIADTLDYAQLDAETPQLASVQLPALVDSLLRQRAPQIREHAAEIAVHFGVTAVVSWERGLVQIAGNLLDNALKYSRDARPPQLRIETAETPLTWQLAVYDNGIGFDMKHHDRIFGLFQRLVTAEQFEGTGAGLAIVRKITDRLGGTVRAEGRPGGGATFLVELPKIATGELT